MVKLKTQIMENDRISKFILLKLTYYTFFCYLLLFLLYPPLAMFVQVNEHIEKVCDILSTYTFFLSDCSLVGPFLGGLGYVG